MKYLSTKRPACTILALFSALAMTGQAAKAALVTRDVDVTLNAENLESYSLDLDGNGVTDFTLDSDYVPDPTIPVAFDQVEFTFGTSNAAVIDGEINAGFPNISLLQPGNVVSASSDFSGPNDTGNLSSFDPFNGATGDFIDKSGVIGLRFEQGTTVLYGFAEVTVDDINDPTNPFGLTIGEVGYDDAGLPVTIPSVPEPASAGVVVLMGSLILLQRRLSQPRLTLATALR